ncbi:hypothetical protein P4H39_31125 [Paenibacillus lautus]|uniref:hypothetical protein n=1 Tax=Paenibacillus lautus TaxID=1401 RepID=UPI002DB8980A|nr:hypothetical protein [Paenibacillus lautus]MEC0207067.1 hypothetical protein [Paenibacillus lautus]
MHQRTQLSFHSPFVKFISAFVAAISLPVISEILKIVLYNKRVVTSNLGYEFTITIIINLTLLFLIILPLSVWVEGLVGSQIKRKQTQRSFINAIFHIFIGIISGVIYSLFIPNTTPVGPILYGIKLAVIYFIYQSIFIWIIKKRAKRVS